MNSLYKENLSNFLLTNQTTSCNGSFFNKPLPCARTHF